MFFGCFLLAMYELSRYEHGTNDTSHQQLFLNFTSRVECIAMNIYLNLCEMAYFHEDDPNLLTLCNFLLDISINYNVFKLIINYWWDFKTNLLRKFPKIKICLTFSNYQEKSNSIRIPSFTLIFEWMFHLTFKML